MSIGNSLPAYWWKVSRISLIYESTAVWIISFDPVGMAARPIDSDNADVITLDNTPWAIWSWSAIKGFWQGDQWWGRNKRMIEPTSRRILSKKSWYTGSLSRRGVLTRGTRSDARFGMTESNLCRSVLQISAVGSNAIECSQIPCPTRVEIECQYHYHISVLCQTCPAAGGYG